MRAVVVYTEQADADVDRIFDDLCRKAGLKVGADYLEQFERLATDLALFPNAGAPRPELRRDIRIGIVSPYLMIYRHQGDDVVQVLRVVHGSQLIARALLGKHA